MPYYTKYRNLTTSELLSQLDSIRLHSPIINELITRIEEDNVLANKLDPPNSCCNNDDRVMSCPVCESLIRVSYDQEEDLFRLSTAS